MRDEMKQEQSQTLKYTDHFFDLEHEAYEFYLKSGVKIERQHRGGETVWIVTERTVVESNADASTF